MTPPSEGGEPTTRPYHSPLRERQAAETRTLILEALAQVIAEGGTTDFTVEDVAAQAGVATRTVYRHFPSRQALLDALAEHLDERFGELRAADELPGLVDDVPDADALLSTVPAVMRRFDDLEPFSTAMVLTANRGMLRSQRHDRRTEQFRELLAGKLERVDAGQRDAVFALARHLLSSQTWFALRKEFGLDGETAGRTVAQAIGALLDAAATDRQP